MTASHSRIEGYDLARGLAVLLMIVLNFKGVLAGNDAGPLWLSQILDHLDRRAAAALVMISGAGTTLYYRQNCPPGTAADDSPGGKGCRTAGITLANRALFLLFAGLVLSLVWSGDILHFYGVFILMGVFLAGRSTPVLFAIAMLVLAGSWIKASPLFEMLENGFGSVPADFLMDLLLTGFFPVFPWAGFFVAGMGLGRLDIRKPDMRFVIWGTGLTLAGGAEILSLAVPADWTKIDLTVPTPISVVSGLGTGLCLIMTGIEIGLRPERQLFRLLAAAGRTSLSFYLFHILVLLLISEYWDGMQNLWTISAGAILLFFLYGAWAEKWTARMGRGPLEAAMRRFNLVRRRREAKPDIPGPVLP